MKGLKCQAEELGCCPHNTGKLWKDLSPGRVMIGLRIQDPLDSRGRVDPKCGGSEAGSPAGTDSPRCSNGMVSLCPVTPVDGGSSGTWGRSGPPKKEELVGGKKKGRTWGPSSTLQKERAGGEERYWPLEPSPAPGPTPRPRAAKPPSLVPPAG